ncbi:MAG: hypothetical protein J5879_06135, partial [Clostridia bacterium]|nr:hypothetical protein [Clostridia bacterium]
VNNAETWQTLTITMDGTNKTASEYIEGLYVGDVVVVEETTTDANVTTTYTPSNGTVTIVEGNDNNVEIKNERPNYTLTIKKSTALDQDKSKTFTFSVAIENGETKTVTATANEPGTTTVPKGCKVTVSEVDTQNYENNMSVSQIFNMPEAQIITDMNGNKELTFTNVRKTVKVYVEKFVDNILEEDIDKEFTFVATDVTGATKTITTKATVLPDGSISVSHTASDENFIEIPIGTSVTVVEQGATIYDTDWYIVGNEQNKTVNKTATVNNVYAETTVIFTNKRPDVTLTIKKDVDLDADKSTSFHFNVTINGTQMTGDDAVYASENTAWSTQIPYGSTVSVSEDMDYLVDGTHKVSQLYNASEHPTVTNEVLTANAEYKFTNVRKTATMTITKVVSSNYAGDIKEYEFKYSINGGTEKTFSITPEKTTVDGVTSITKSYTLPDALYAYDVVAITETTKDDNVTVTGEGSYTMQEGTNGATITNTRPDVELVIKKFVDRDVDANKTFNFKVTIGNVEPNILTETYGVTSKKTGSDNAGFSISVPKGLYVKVEEVTSDNYETKNGITYKVSDLFTTPDAIEYESLTAESTEADFTNTRKTGTLKVEKTVVSNYAPDKSAAYSFTYAKNETDNAGSFTITTSEGAGSYTIEDLFVGDLITVTEGSVDYMTTTYGADDSTTPVAITIAEGNTNTLKVKNERPDIGLTIKKFVDRDIDADKTFYFKVTIDGVAETEARAVTSKKTGSENSGITIQIPKGLSVSVEELTNTTYNDTDYTVAQLFTTTPASSAIEHLTEAQTLEFTNTRRTGTLTVTKAVVSDYAPDKSTSAVYGFSYTVNGVSRGTFAIAGEDSYTIQGLLVGDVVVVTEANINNMTTAYSKPNGTVTIVEGNGNELTVTNTRANDTLTINKTVDLDRDKTGVFTFEVKIKDGETKTVTATANAAGTVQIPHGCEVTVTEKDTANYEGTYSVSQIFNMPAAQTVTMNGDKSLTFANTRKKVKIYVEKFVDSLDPDDFVSFGFKVNGTDLSVTGRNVPTTGTITLTNGENYVLVPIGTDVTVVENEVTNYTTDWYIYGSTQEHTTNRTAAIGVVYADATVIFTNKRPEVKLTIKKDVDRDADKSLSFRFKLTINGTEEYVMASENEAWSRATIPYGSIVSVSEDMTYVMSGEYTTGDLFKANAHPTVSGVKLTAASTEYTFKNERRTGSLTVTKEVVSNYAPDYANGKEYKFTYTVNNGEAQPLTITMTGEKTATGTITGLLVSDVVVVTENALNDAFMEASAAVTVTIKEGSENSAKITNTRKPVTVTVIKQLAEVDTFNTDTDFAVKLAGTNGTATTETTKTAKVGGENAVFEIPYGTVFSLTEPSLAAKYDDPTFAITAGTDVLTETEDGYKAMGNGTITVTNKVKRIPVTVKKTVIGDDDDKADDYTFSLASSIEGTVTSDAEGATAITTVTVTGGTSEVVYVPYGATLTVTETGGGVEGHEYNTIVGGEYKETYTTAAITAEGTTVEFKNVRLLTVTVTKKVVSGLAADKDAEYSFEYYATATLGEEPYAYGTAVKIKDAEGSKFEITVEYGQSVNIHEILDEEYVITSVSGNDLGTDRIYVKNNITSDTSVVFVN